MHMNPVFGYLMRKDGTLLLSPSSRQPLIALLEAKPCWKGGNKTKAFTKGFCRAILEIFEERSGVQNPIRLEHSTQTEPSIPPSITHDLLLGGSTAFALGGRSCWWSGRSQ